MNIRPLLLAVLVAIAVVFAVPAAAQPEPNATCFFEPTEGYFCLNQQVGVLFCPVGEPAEEGETLECSRFLEYPSIPTGEAFDCLVLQLIAGGPHLEASCTPADNPPGPEPDQEQKDKQQKDRQQPGGGAAAPLELTQETEQEAESGDIGQSFDVSQTGDNSNQCASPQGVANTGNPQNVIDLLQAASDVDDFEFEEVGSDITVSPESSTTCDQQVNQAASASG